MDVAHRAMVEAELWMALGEPARARTALTAVNSSDLSDHAIPLARLELALGEPDAALRAVAGFLADDRESLMPVSRTEAWAVDAIARDAIHDEPSALRAIERALDLAEPRGYRNAILRHGAAPRIAPSPAICCRSSSGSPRRAARMAIPCSTHSVSGS